MPVSLSRSQEYSWSDDWQSGRTTCKETEIRKLKSRSNQNRISLSKNNFMATEHNILLVKHAPVQTVSPHFPFSLVLEWLCQQYLQPTCKRNLEARTSSCQNSTASPKWHFMPRLFGEQVCLASQYFKGEYQKYWSTLLCVWTRCSKVIESKGKHTGYVFTERNTKGLAMGEFRFG